MKIYNNQYLLINYNDDSYNYLYSYIEIKEAKFYTGNIITNSIVYASSYSIKI